MKKLLIKGFHEGWIWPIVGAVVLAVAIAWELRAFIGRSL